jgi:hypothetical protein
MQEIPVNPEYVIAELTQEIARLTRENAVKSAYIRTIQESKKKGEQKNEKE